MITPLSSNNFILENIDTASPALRIGGSKKIILMIKADWCRYCNAYLPTFSKFSDTITDYKFCVLEQTSNKQLLKWWSMLAKPSIDMERLTFPTLILYDKDGTPIRKIEDRFNLKKELS